MKTTRAVKSKIAGQRLGVETLENKQMLFWNPWSIGVSDPLEFILPPVTGDPYTDSGYTPVFKSGPDGTYISAMGISITEKDAFGGSLVVQGRGNITLDIGFNAVSLSSISISKYSSFDIGQSHVRVAPGGFNEADIRSRIVQGRDTSYYGIFSGPALSTTNRDIGYIVSDGVLEMAYAAPGDTNLDGCLDLLDVMEITASGRFGTGAAANWQQGDFNYDGVFDLLDVTSFRSTGLYNKGSYLTPVPLGSNAVATASVASVDPALAFAAFAVESDTQATNKPRIVAAVP